MDGLCSGSRDRKVTVIGVTHGLYNLDDAVLRRLPRMLLIDLQRENEEETLNTLLRVLRRAPTLIESQRGQGSSLDLVSNMSPHPSQRLLTKCSTLIDLCVAAVMDAVNVGVILPRRTVLV